MEFYRILSYLLVLASFIIIIISAVRNKITLSCPIKKAGKKGIIHAMIFGVFLVLFIIFLDKPLKDLFQSLSAIEPFMKAADHVGNGRYQYPVLAFLFVTASIFSFPKLKRIFAVSLFSSVVAGLLNQILKFVTHRAKPYISENPLDFFRFDLSIQMDKLLSVDFKSFASGHTVIAFAAITPIALAVKNKALRILILLIPFSTGLARVYLNKHWFSDVIVGALIGYYFTKNIFFATSDQIYK